MESRNRQNLYSAEVLAIPAQWAESFACKHFLNVSRKLHTRVQLFDQFEGIVKGEITTEHFQSPFPFHSRRHLL